MVASRAFLFLRCRKLEFKLFNFKMLNIKFRLHFKCPCLLFYLTPRIVDQLISRHFALVSI